MTGFSLLAAVTVLRAGYNPFVKPAGNRVSSGASTTALAAMCLQVAALSASPAFFGVPAARGGQAFSPSAGSRILAAIAGP